MISEKEFNDKLFRPDMELRFTPAHILNTFKYYLESYGLEVLYKHRNSKKLKEMWAGAVFALGYQKITNTEQYISPCFDATPDVILGTYIGSRRVAEGEDFAIMNVEITEWESWAKQDLVSRIKDKLSNKKYPKDYILLIHITRVGRLEEDLDYVYEQISIEKPDIQSIWALAGSSTEQSGDNYFMFSLYPKKYSINFSLSEFHYNDAKRFPQILNVPLKSKDIEMYIGEIKMELPNLD